MRVPVLRAVTAVAAAAALVLTGTNPALAKTATVSETAAVPAAATTTLYHEPYRPQLSYSPQANWMNDPNGLIYDNGEYNLFYQYNPNGSTWGDISWGHAVSTDLVHWKQEPLAIPATSDELIFSGSVVLDKENTSGFGTTKNPPMVAVYTSDYPSTGIQAQSLAYSLDGGTTWTKYAGNPVLDIGSQNFRDPKVFWYSPKHEWLMTVALSSADEVEIYSSANLKDWTKVSTFGPAGDTDGVWEMPDLYPLKVDGKKNDVKWVLMVGVDNQDQYFVGDFDGTTFTPDEPVTYSPPAGTVLADFEGSTYADWSTTGTAFGNGPAQGALPGQQTVEGYDGSGFVDSFTGGDASTGTLTSPKFTISDSHLNFLVGGGDHPYVKGSNNDGAAPTGQAFEGFDGSTYDGWSASGTAFGSAPAAGALAGQQTVSGYAGAGLANSFNGGDAATGTLTSPSFTITQKYIDFLVGGGDHPDTSSTPTAVDLVIDGQVVESATGEDSESLNWTNWDVSRYQGDQATIQIVDGDGATGSGAWAHILADDFLFSDQAAQVFDDFEGSTWGTGWTATGDFVNAGPTAESLSGEQGNQALDTCVGSCDPAEGTITSPVFTITQKYIDLLVGGGDHPESAADPTAVNLVVNGQIVDTATGSDSADLDWKNWDVSKYQGQQATIQVVDENDGSSGWGHLIVDDIVFSDHAAAPYDHQTTVNLVVDGAVVDSTTGNDSEALDWASWNVKAFEGKQAQITIIDNNSSGWGHINADEFMESNEPALDMHDRANWVDDGADFYAANTFNDAPRGQRILLAWMNNWTYGADIPTSPWRSADTVARQLGLTTVGGKTVLTQQPIKKLDSLRVGRPVVTRSLRLDGSRTLPITGETLDLDETFRAGTASTFGLNVRVGNGQRTQIGYDKTTGTVYVDRTGSGDSSFAPGFASVQSALVSLKNGTVTFRVIVDTSSVEVFVDQGRTALTDQVFPASSSIGVSAFATGGSALLLDGKAWHLSSIWYPHAKAVS